MDKFAIKETKKKDPHFAVHLPQVDFMDYMSDELSEGSLSRDVSYRLCKLA